MAFFKGDAQFLITDHPQYELPEHSYHRKLGHKGYKVINLGELIIINNFVTTVLNIRYSL